MELCCIGVLMVCVICMSLVGVAASSANSGSRANKQNDSFMRQPDRLKEKHFQVERN